MSIIKIPCKYLVDCSIRDLITDPNVVIELDYKKFIQQSCGYREFFVEWEGLGQVISKFDVNEEESHVEFAVGIDDKTNTPLCRIWGIQYWRAEYKRLLLVRRESERDRQERDRRIEQTKELAQKMSEKMGLPVHITKALAEQIVNTSNRIAAQTWGLDVSDWHVGDDELDKIIKEQNTIT